MIRKKKLYLKPRKMFEKARIEEENTLVKKYALKNKREIWKTLAKVNYFRSRAKALAKSSIEEQEVLFKKLKTLGLKTNSIAEVLDLKVEDLLERRISTVVAKNGLTNTTKQARQMIIHKKILVDRGIVNSPSYLVPVSLENKIRIKEKKTAPKKTDAPAEVKADEKIEQKTEENTVAKEDKSKGESE